MNLNTLYLHHLGSIPDAVDNLRVMMHLAEKL